MYEINQFPESVVQSRLPGSGKTYIVCSPTLANPGQQFFLQFPQRHIFASLASFTGGMAELAEDAVQGTCLERRKVNAQRTSKTPGWNWTKKMFHRIFQRSFLAPEYTSSGLSIAAACPGCFGGFIDFIKSKSFPFDS